MKRKRFLAVGIIALLLCNLLAACAKQEPSLEEWEKAEIKRIKSYVGSGMYYDAQGRSFQLIDEGLFEKPLVVHYWATRSSISVKGLDAFQEAYEKYGDEVQFLMINAFDGVSDTMEDAEELIREKGYTFPVYYDRAQNLGKLMRVEQFPYTLFIGKKYTLEHVRNTQLTAEEIGRLIEEIR